MEICEVSADLARAAIERLILSGPRDKNEIYRKVMIRPVMIRGEKMFQIERFTQKQAFQQNISEEALEETLTELLTDHYMQLDGWTKTHTAFVKISRKGKVLYRKKPIQGAGDVCDTNNLLSELADTDTKETVSSQNRKKQYLLEAKDAPLPLVELGVVTKDGKVVASKYDKYKQINRFVELIDHGIEEDVTHLNVVDFGCGKSYLTFVLYDYLTRVRGIEVEMVGLDLKEAVIEKCNAIAKQNHYDHLRFEVGDINGYQPSFKVDLVISLHACDTATDFALYNAIAWGTERIYSVPCCQHELNHQINKNSLGTLSEYGLLKDRFAALLTDSIRADLLEWQGYKVDVLEFVDFAHSPKNVLIRGIRRKGANGESRADAKKNERSLTALERVEKAIETYHVNPTLYQLLKEKETN